MMISVHTRAVVVRHDPRLYGMLTLIKDSTTFTEWKYNEKN